MTTNKQTEQWTPFDTDIDEFKAFKNIISNHTLRAARWYLQGKREGYLEALGPTGVRDALEACYREMQVADFEVDDLPEWNAAMKLARRALKAISGPG